MIAAAMQRSGRWLLKRCQQQPGFDVNALLPFPLPSDASYRAPMLVLAAAHEHPKTTRQATSLQELLSVADKSLADSRGCTWRHFQVCFCVMSVFYRHAVLAPQRDQERLCAAPAQTAAA